MSSEDIWNIIHQNYGENLDLTTDEEDSYQQKQTFYSTPNQIQTKQNLSSNTQVCPFIFLFFLNENLFSSFFLEFHTKFNSIEIK